MSSIWLAEWIERKNYKKKNRSRKEIVKNRDFFFEDKIRLNVRPDQHYDRMFADVRHC